MATKSSQEMSDHQPASGIRADPVAGLGKNSAKARSRRVLMWIGGILSGLFVLLMVAAGLMFMRMNTVPDGLDYAASRVSDQGLFKVSYTPSTNPIPINQMHHWTLHVENADGQPVEGAQINVDGDMPQHGHGLPTRPRVTKYLGDGDYLVEGMKFQMSGWWVMDFTVIANGKEDIVHFNLLLK